MDKTGDLTYFVGANLSDFRDKVVSLGGLGTTDPRYDGGKIVLSGDFYYAEGKQRNGFYLYQTDGLYVDQAELDASVRPSTLTRPGDIKFIDRNGDKQINSDDKYFSSKTSTPHFIYGFNFGGEYKGFDFMAVFNGVGERWAMRHRLYIYSFRLDMTGFKNNYENRWNPEHPDKWADGPRLTSNNWLSNDFATITGAACEYQLRNYAYVRLKNLQIGYTLPQQLTQKFFVSKLRIFFTGENLFYYAPGYTEFLDPESDYRFSDGAGSGNSFYGQNKVFSGGVSVTF
jgi:hypothetical protein